MRMNRWAFLGIFLIVFVSVFSGERSDQGDNSGDTPFRIAHSDTSPSLDPHFFTDKSSLRLWNALFKGLVVADPESAEGQPGEALSWDILDNGLTYIFHLSGSCWTDGTPVTAGQVEASWKRILDPATGSPHAWYPAHFLRGAEKFVKGGSWDDVGVKVLDPHTLRVELSGPYPFFINALCHQSFAILPMHLLNRYGTRWTDPGILEGNGPYVLADSQQSEGILLNKNPSHDCGEEPDSLYFRTVTDPEDAYRLYAKGELDWVPADLFPFSRFRALKERDDFTSSPGGASYFYVFNGNRPPLDDKDLRDMMSLSIDRKLLVKSVLQGTHIPAYTLNPAFQPSVPESRKEIFHPVPPDQIRLTLTFPEEEGHRAVAEFLRDQWNRNPRMDITLKGCDFETFTNDRKSGNYDLILAVLQGDIQDPTAFLNLFLTGEPSFGAVYSNPDYDRLLSEASWMAEGPGRLQKLKEAEVLLSSEDRAVLPLFFYEAPQLIDKTKWGGHPL